MIMYVKNKNMALKKSQSFTVYVVEGGVEIV